MNVVAYDPYVQQADVDSKFRMTPLDKLLTESDFVVLATALTAETKHLIGAAELALMKPSAYLINVGRGGLVNEADLLTALKSQQIAGVGLDVWEQEPVSPDHPLLALENVVGTPHCLAATRESLDRLCQGIASNILRVLNGQPPLNVVNSEVIVTQTGA